MVGNDPLRTLKNSSRLSVCQVTHRVLVGQHFAVDLMQTSSDVCGCTCSSLVAASANLWRSCFATATVNRMSPCSPAMMRLITPYALFLCCGTQTCIVVYRATRVTTQWQQTNRSHGP